MLILMLSLLLLPRTVVAASCDANAESLNGQAPELHRAEASPLQYQFASGARWELCWHIDKHSGLVLSRVFYGAPAEHLRQVLDAASLGQILLKYDEDINTSHLLSEHGLGGDQLLSPDQSQCQRGELISGVNGEQICHRIRQLNHMTKARNSESVRRHELSLHAWSRIGNHWFQQIWRLSEDGEIKPSVLFSGTIDRYTSDPRFGIRLSDSIGYASSATLLYNWRLDFNINGTPENDLVSEFEFLPVVTDVVKREINIRPLPVETMRTTHRENFRGWRISDAEQSSDAGSGTGGSAMATTRIGYYLDPQSAGFRNSSNEQQWPQFDFALTTRNPCEQLASANKQFNAACADSLDEYVNEQSLENTDIVVWFSVSQHFTPRLEDFPAITATETGFKLVPFDWSAQSPFSPASESPTVSVGLEDQR